MNLWDMDRNLRPPDKRTERLAQILMKICVHLLDPQEGKWDIG